MIKRSFLLASIFAAISTMSCNPLNTQIPYGTKGETVTLRQLVRRANRHTCGKISVLDYMSAPGDEDGDPVHDKTESEIISSLRDKLEAFTQTPDYKTMRNILASLPAGFFSIESQEKEWARSHGDKPTKSMDASPVDADEIIVEVPTDQGTELDVFLAEENALFTLLESAASYLSFSLPSPVLCSPCPSSASASPETARRSPPAGSPKAKILDALKMAPPAALATWSQKPRISRKRRTSPLSPPRAVSTTPMTTT